MSVENEDEKSRSPGGAKCHEAAISECPGLNTNCEWSSSHRGKRLLAKKCIKIFSN